MRKFFAESALFWPRTRLYSTVPLSSQWPSILTFLPLFAGALSQFMFSFNMAASPSLMAYLSKSKLMSFIGDTTGTTTFCSGETLAGSAAGGGVSPFMCCQKHPQPPREIPMKATSKIRDNDLIFIFHPFLQKLEGIPKATGYTLAYNITFSPVPVSLLRVSLLRVSPLRVSLLPVSVLPEASVLPLPSVAPASAAPRTDRIRSVKNLQKKR